jgi:trans-aconitate methyltransferase
MLRFKRRSDTFLGYLVAGEWLQRSASARDNAVQVDVRRAHSARVYDYWLGGKDNFAADRDAAEEAIGANPGIVGDARANRAFLARAVAVLARDHGVRQFLDIGTGLPSGRNTHEIAQSIEPAARVVYVDNDPIVLAHARAMLISGPDGHCGYVDADLRDPAIILKAAARTLDLNRPVALLLLLVLHLIPDEDGPHEVVSSLLKGLATGSYLVVSHPASDVRPDSVAEMTRRMNQRLRGPKATLRDRGQTGRFFDGLELLEPGVVQLPQWRPDPGEPTSPDVPLWCGAGRKP